MTDKPTRSSPLARACAAVAIAAVIGLAAAWTLSDPCRPGARVFSADGKGDGLLCRLAGGLAPRAR